MRVTIGSVQVAKADGSEIPYPYRNVVVRQATP